MSPPPLFRFPNEFGLHAIYYKPRWPLVPIVLALLALKHLLKYSLGVVSIPATLMPVSSESSFDVVAGSIATTIRLSCGSLCRRDFSIISRRPQLRLDCLQAFRHTILAGRVACFHICSTQHRGTLVLSFLCFHMCCRE